MVLGMPADLPLHCGCFTPTCNPGCFAACLQHVANHCPTSCNCVQSMHSFSAACCYITLLPDNDSGAMQMAKISNVGVHNLSPGMVTTELLMSGADTSTAKFFINCLGG
jgi:hypothetical protein